jgi:hypothetical protein
MPNRKIVNAVCSDSDCKGGKGYCLLSEILGYFGHGQGVRIPEGVNCARGRNDCVLKDKIMETPITDRILVQLKCIEIFKYEECAARGNGANLTWNEAFELWRDRGHAESFARVYSEEVDPREIYLRVVGRAA